MSSGLKALERLRGAPPPGLEEVMAKLKAAGPSRGTWVRTARAVEGPPAYKARGAREADGSRGSAESSSVTKTSCLHSALRGGGVDAGVSGEIGGR